MFVYLFPNSAEGFGNFCQLLTHCHSEKELNNVIMEEHYRIYSSKRYKTNVLGIGRWLRG